MPGAIEIRVEQLAKPLLPEGGVRFLVEHLDRTVPELVHKRYGIRRIDDRRSRKRRGRHQQEKAGQKGTTHHLGETFPG